MRLLTVLLVVGSLGLSAQQPSTRSVNSGSMVSQVEPSTSSGQGSLPRLNAWSQFRGNPQLTGVAPSELSLPLKLLWTYEAGEAIDSSAAIVDGTVFVGSASGELIALDLQNGALRWKYQTGSQIGDSSPAVANGAVYIGDLAGMFHAVDAKSGKTLWTFKTGSEIRSSPVVAGDKVLIGSYDQHLYGLSVRDGALAWKVEFEGYVHATPAILDGVAYLVGCDETFRGIRVSDGREIFNAPIGAYMGASPALSGNSAYVGTFNNEVISVNLQSRNVLWRYRHPERLFPYYSSAAVAQGRVVLGGRDRMVHALDARTGKAVWTFMSNARIDSSPAISGNRVFIGANDDRLYVLDLMTGAKQWEFNGGAAFSASPAIAAGRLVIGAQDGRVYCFG